MPKFAANISMMFNEFDFLDRFAAAAAAGFEGVDGIFRFLKDRTNERGLAIAEVRNKQVYIIDPAPRFFRF